MNSPSNTSLLVATFLSLAFVPVRASNQPITAPGEDTSQSDVLPTATGSIEMRASNPGWQLEGVA